MLSAGQLDRRITLQRKTTTLNDLREAVEAWRDLATVWAAKREVSDVERERAAELGSGELTMRFQIRWSAEVDDLNGRDRVLFGGVAFNIAGVRHLDREEGYGYHEAMEISAAARSDQGDAS